MRFLLATLALSLFANSAFAQAPDTGAKATAARTFVIDGPAPSPTPNVMTRDTSNGKSTVRAIKLKAPLKFDGKLDDEVYTQYQPFDGLVQAAPDYGKPATERTDIWVTYDTDAIYVSARCWDPAPPEQWIANELRRDTNQMRNNDHFGVAFDTFYDRRSGFMFYANVLGGFADYSVIDEGGSNTDWNPVWDVRTGRFDGGWTIEIKIPFKTLRYTSGPDQVWGIQFRRAIRHKNEWDYWTPVPRTMAGPQALNRISAYGTLVGLDLPPAGRNLELKPYALGKMATDRLTTPAVSNKGDASVGGDLKYGVTANLTADLTVNTDFAQVEIDEQQVNLTRFNLFLPEKREFFLEGRGLFDFGRGGAGAGGGPGGTGSSSDQPYLFYTRRIGLNRNRVVPIDVGGRLTGKVGKFGIGVMNIETGDESVSKTPSTNFTVMRVKRDILRRSTIGAIFTNRNKLTSNQPGDNQAYGVDAAFGFYQNIAIGTYFAQTKTTNVTGDDKSYQAKFDWVPDRYGLQAEVLKVGKAFNPEVGFLRRSDFIRGYGSARFSPRPRKVKNIRKYTYQAAYEYYENGSGQVESRQATGRFNIEFNNSDTFNVEANANYDYLATPFRPNPGSVIPVGGYSYNDMNVQYNMGPQRRLSGNLNFSMGEYYNGTIRALTFSSGRYSILKQFSLEPRFSVSHVELPTSSFTQKQIGARTDYGFSARMFLGALLQYSSADHTFSSNVRYRWEYRPGSELFVVWTDEHDTNPLDPHANLALRNRAFVVKMTRLFRF